MLHELSCPKCGAPGLEAHQPNGIVVCRHCGNQFADDGQIACPHCESINPPDADFCHKCGDKLKRTCPACGGENWMGADYCAACGHNLDAIASMANRHTQGFKGTLQQQRELANLLKAEEESSSQKRMADLWDIEKRRQANLEHQRARLRAEQNVLLFIAIAIGAVFVFAVAGALFLFVLAK
ncbi:MAG: hypothetical protein FJ030_01435 [Chloroflexi bacterium]|nr:hypothetical protein [Chloroflexota bacterium]